MDSPEARDYFDLQQYVLQPLLAICRGTFINDRLSDLRMQFSDKYYKDIYAYELVTHFFQWKLFNPAFFEGEEEEEELHRVGKYEAHTAVNNVFKELHHVWRYQAHTIMTNRGPARMLSIALILETILQDPLICSSA
jgi:hypothetical protein